MKTKYLVLTEKVGRGCPAGGLNAILYDKFYERNVASRIDFGSFEWYGGMKYVNGKTLFAPLPANLVLISRDRLYEFDIRNTTRFEIVSVEFVRIALALGAKFDDCESISVLSPDGKRISSKDYFVTRVKRFEPEEAIDERNTEFDEGLDICSLVMNEDVEKNIQASLFKISGLSPSCDPIFCTESFANGMSRYKLSGFDFLPLEEVQWPAALKAEIDSPMPMPTNFL